MARLARFCWLSLKVIAVLVALAILLAGISVAFLAIEADKRLGDVAALTNPSQARLPQPIKVYSAEKRLIGSSGAQQRIIVTGNRISPNMRNATVAIEDQRFYQHQGVDFQAIARALWVNARSGASMQGASTITQQYVRNVYLNFEKTNIRKAREAALALQLEGVWSKRRILDSYLNTVYFANGCYGVEAAARYYFGVTAAELTPAQSALLAAIVKDPEAYNPRSNPSQAKARRNLVLDEMFAQGYITRRQVVGAKRGNLGLVPPPPGQKISPANRQLLTLTLTELNRTLSEPERARGGLNVYTSYNMAMISRSRDYLSKVYQDLDYKSRPVIATSFLDPRNGRIVVLAHSKKRGFFNYATQAIRQPGSTVKAFTVASLLARGGRLSDPVDNSAVEVKDERRGSYTITPTQGAPTVADAIRFSQNPAFWRLYQKAGPRRVLALEKRLGLNKMDANAAAALGGTKLGASSLQMASAYGTFADDGLRQRPHTIVTVRDFLGNTVWTDKELGSGRRALPDEYARQVNKALVRVVSDGFPQLKESITLSKSREVAGKTGTTEDNADAWFVGYTPQLSGAVWTGYPTSRRPLESAAGEAIYGATVPAQTWNKLASEMLRNRPALKFPPPRNVQRVPRVVGFSLQEANRRLALMRFTNVTQITKFDADSPAGRVVLVSPGQGSWVSPKRQIRLTYTINEKPMPTLVGSNYIDLIEGDGRFFNLSVRVVPSAKPTGTILSQSIPPLVPVKKNAALTVTLATKRAPAKIKTKIERVPYTPSGSELSQLRAEARRESKRETIPDIIGLPMAQAQDVLESIGMRTRAVGSGTVESTDPSPGTRVSRGTTITLSG